MHSQQPTVYMKYHITQLIIIALVTHQLNCILDDFMRYFFRQLCKIMHLDCIAYMYLCIYSNVEFTRTKIHTDVY